MRVNLYEIDKDTGKERLRQKLVLLIDAIPDDAERASARIELNHYGRCWIGGGAAPLFLLILQHSKGD